MSPICRAISSQRYHFMTGEYRVVIIVITSIIIIIIIITITTIAIALYILFYSIWSTSLLSLRKEISVNLIVTPLSFAVHLEGVYRKKSVFPRSQETSHFVHMILLSARYWG